MFNNEKLQHFSIRKLTIGAASVLIGVSFSMMANSHEVHADTINEPIQNNQTVNNSENAVHDAKTAAIEQEVPAQNYAETPNATSQTENSADQTKKVDQNGAANLSQDTNLGKHQNTDPNKQTQIVDQSTLSTDKETKTPRLAENKIQTTNLLVVKQKRQQVEPDLTENKVEKQDTDKLSASLKDGTTIVISRNTIGATGDTSPLTMQVVYHGVKQGDIYTITVPKGRAYGLSDPQTQRLHAFGSTDVQYQNNATEIINTFDKDTNEGNITSQTFTLNPANNYGSQSVTMPEIGDVIKTITIDKKGVDGSVDKASLNITQVISPEMNPTFKRIIPNSQISEVYNNTDYTYELRINETDGIQKGISYASGQVNNAVNWGTTITIPVPPDFVLNTDRTAIVNNFKRNGDQTTITQIGGKGGNIVINAPKGSGRQGYEDQVPAYRLVGHYENTEAGTTHANGKITIHQLVTRDDGSTYYIDRELDPWSENITSGKGDSLSDISVGIMGYSPKNIIPTTVDQKRPINSFYFQNTNAVNLENPHLTFDFDDDLRINRITTPVDQIKLPGLTNYQYTAQLSDGGTINGNIEAGKELTVNDGIYIKNIILTPNLLAAGAGMDQYDKQNQIKAYGSISDTLKNNDKVNTQMGADYTVNINGQLVHKVLAKNINCLQTIQEASAYVSMFAPQSKQAPGSIDSGYMSIYRSGNSIDATAHEVEEPILYYVLPKYTSYNKNIGVTYPNSGAKVPPKVTTFTVGDHEVVKIDFTGTGDKISTLDNANTHIDLDISVLAKPGNYKCAIYIESPKTAITNWKATDSSFYNPAFTEGKTDRVYEVGQGNWTIGSAVETGIVSGALGNQNAVSVSRGSSDDKGDPNMAFDFNVINRNGQLDDVTAVIDLSDHKQNAFNFELTEPVTIEEKETNNHTEILYSVDKFAKPDTTISYQPDLSSFKTADQMSKDDWKNVKTIAFKIGNLEQNSSSSVFRIHGRDNTLASDAGKSYSYSTYLFGTGVSPSYTSYLTNPSITISGKSTVKYQVHYTDNNGQEHTVETNDLNKAYNDNQDNMADKASVINDFNNYAKTHDIIPANYKLGGIEIIDGGKTWQTDEPNKKIDFGEKIQYFADGDIVQIDLVPNTKGSVKVIYHDDTNNTDLTNYDYNSGDQYDGTSVDYNSSNVDTVKNDLINKGYKYVSIDGTIPAKIIGNQNNIVTVHFIHDTFNVDHQHPFRKYTETDLQKTANRTINYVDEHGQTVKDSSKVAVIFNATGVVDKVTGNLVTLNSDGSIKDQKGKLSWTSTANSQTQNGDSYSFETVQLDKNLNHNGTNYRLDHVDPGSMLNGDYIKSSTVTAENPQDQTITVVYHTITYHESKPIIKTITRTINYVDAQTGKKIIPSTTQKATLSRTQILDDQGNVIGFGSVNSDGKSYVISNTYKINNGWITIDVPDLTSRGYRTNTKQVAGEEVDQNSQDKVVTVPYDHILVPVDEHSQDKHGVSIHDLAKDVHETVHFVDENNNKLRDDNVQTRHYTRTVTVDLTNNQIVTNPATDIDWHLADNQDSNYSEVKAPVITGYFADKKTVPSTKVVQDEINQTVTYKKIGSVIAIDKSGHRLADPIRFANDENDPTKAVAVNAPDVLNYHLVNSNDKVVKPNNDLTQDVNVVYAKDQGSVKVVFIDDTTGKTLSNVGYNSGNIDFDTPITYKTADDLAKLTKQGYVYNSTDGNIPAKVVANKNIAITVHVRHGLVPVNENSQDKHGVSIHDLAKDVHETVQFVDEHGNKLRDNNVQTRHYTRTVTVDLTNNQIMTNPATNIDWHLADNQDSDYSEVNAPIITGYFADKKTIPSTKVVQDEISQTITYKNIGSVIAIDKDGHQLADPIQFTNDENDPTKAVAVNAPDVLNYHLVNSNDKVVKPNNDLTQDVNVVYAKDQGSVKVVFIDDTTGKTLSNVGYNSGNIDFDTPITYKTADDLAKLTKQGYVYSNTIGNIPEKVVANQNIAIAIHVRHGVIVITSKTPKDDLPANLDQNLVPNKLTKEVTLTVNYVNEDGTPFTGQVPENAKQTITFNGTAYVDKVTGKLVNVKTVDNQLIVDTDNNKTPAIIWTSNKTSFDKVISPVENGYRVDKVSDHADGKDVGAINDIKFDSANITITVSYAKDPDTEPEKDPDPGQDTNLDKKLESEPKSQPTPDQNPTKPIASIIIENTPIKNNGKHGKNRKRKSAIEPINKNKPRKNDTIKTSAAIVPSTVAQNKIDRQAKDTEKQTVNTLPQTGDENNIGIFVLGLALFSLGLGLVIKSDQDK